MEFFLKAKTIKLSSHKDKFLVAEEDRITISLGRDESAKNAVWSVEFIEGRETIRLKSCFGTYLTASSVPFIPGVTGKKVIQTRPCQCDSAAEWEPMRDGMQVRLRSLWGNFLRPNGGLPPWRNSITHDVPHRGKTRDKILWDVEVVEKCPDQRILPASVSDLVDKQSDNVRRVLLSNEKEQSSSNVRCFWYPKACMPFPR